MALAMVKGGRPTVDRRRYATFVAVVLDASPDNHLRIRLHHTKKQTLDTLALWFCGPAVGTAGFRRR